MKTKKTPIRILFALLGLALIGAGVVMAQKGTEKDVEEAVFVTVKPIEVGYIESIIYTKGDVRTRESANLISEISGTVAEVFFNEGDAVEKGDLMIKLDTKTLEKNIRDAKLNMEIAAANYESHVETIKREKESQTTREEIALRNAKLNYEQALKDFEESSALFEAGIISEKEKNAQKTAYDQAYQAYMDAQTSGFQQTDNSKVLLLQLEMARNTYNDLMAMREAYALRAPISGVVTKGQVKTFDLVSPGVALAILETLDDLYVATNIGEYDINKIDLKMPVRISGNAVGETVYGGEIDQIGLSAQVQSQGQATERSVPVKIALLEETGFKPGFSADLEIVVAQSEQAIKLPYEAWIKQGDENVFFTVVDSRAVRHTFELGVEGEVAVQAIVDQVSEGALVILNPPTTLEEGVLIRVIEER